MQTNTYITTHALLVIIFLVEYLQFWIKVEASTFGKASLDRAEGNEPDKSTHLSSMPSHDYTDPITILSDIIIAPLALSNCADRHCLGNV